NVEDESEHGDKGELRRSIEQAHVLELNRLSIMKCAEPRLNLIICCRSGMAYGATAAGRPHSRAGNDVRYAVKEHRLCDAARKGRKNGARGTLDIEGEVTRIGASRRGQRASFNSKRSASRCR